MNKTSENILQSIDLIINKRLSEYNRDLTVQATIIKLNNLETGEYTVAYANQEIIAFTLDLNKIYQKNDLIYMKIPEGNFSNKKIIEGKVNNNKTDINININDINTVSPDIAEIYKISKDAYGVIAGAKEGQNGYEYFIYNDNGDNLEQNKIFQLYSNNYNLLEISASFQTLFYNKHTKGNYGLELSFYTNTEEIVKYYLDFNSFIGNPYNYNIFSEQKVIIDIPKNYLIGLKSIRLFQDKFEYDRYIINGEVSDKENTTDENIFVKNLKIHYVEKEEYKDNTYIIQLFSPKGYVFTENIINIDITANLLYNKEILNNAKCFWYEKDYSVEGTWKEISNNNNKIIINKEDVLYKKTYQVKFIYNDNIIITKNFEIVNSGSEYEIKLIQKEENNMIKLVLETIPIGLKGNWYVTLSDNSFQQINNLDNPVSEIILDSYLMHSSLIFHCSVLNEENIIIATIDYPFILSTNEDDVQVIFSGDTDIHHYDANGDISIELADKVYQLEYNLKWKDGIGSLYKVKWFFIDGTEIKAETSYNPEYSMMTEIKVDNDNNLKYNINRKYRINNNNNKIYLKIILLDGTEYTVEKEIIFVKDGDQGTNGSTYIAAIRPCDEIGNKLSGFWPLKFNNGIWGKELTLKAYVYKNGELLDESKIEYNWSGININFSSITTNSKVIINGSGIELQNNYYLKCELFIENKTKMYVFYPIDVLIGDIEHKDINIDNIPSYIKYTSSGVEPAFYNNDLFFTYNGEIIKNFESLTEDIITIIQSNNDKLYLNPVSQFQNETEQLGSIKCIIDENNYFIHTIITYLNTFGNEAINGWDGLKLDIDGEGQYLLAPQIGAGIKDSYNKFTGVVMGKDTNQNLIGLYGYQEGISTFGLTEDGKAYFGSPSGGRITIDGKTSTISGGGGGNSATGMTITLADLLATGDKKAIQIGGDNFYIQYNGHMFAKNANIEGTITATELTATKKGTIANFTFDANGLSGGTIRCNILEANYGGTIGGWEIDSIGLRSGGTTLNNDGTITTGQIAIIGTGFNGTLGYVAGQNDQGQRTQNIGITSASGQGIILDSNKTIGLKAPNDGIFLEGKSISFNASNTISFSNPDGLINLFGLGTLGYIEGQSDIGITQNIGFRSDYGHGLIFESGKTMKFKALEGIYFEGESISLRSKTTIYQKEYDDSLELFSTLGYIYDTATNKQSLRLQSLPKEDLILKSGASILVESNELNITTPKEKQYGIYARFA